MKNARKIVSLFLSFIVLSCAVLPISAEFTDTGWWGWGEGEYSLKYPLTSRFVKDYCSTHEVMGEWFLHERIYGIDSFSSLWFKTYHLGDPEVWHPDYLDRFETVLAGAWVNRPAKITDLGTQLYDFAVDNYSWNGNALTVCCTMDYDVSQLRYFDSEYGMYYAETIGDLNAYVYLGFTNRSDGKLVNLAKVGDFLIAPEYQYYDSLVGKYHYTCSVSDTFTVEMPSFYDADKHEVTLYFHAPEYESYHIYYYYDIVDHYSIYNPTVLTRDDIVEPEPEPEPPVVEPPEADPTLPKIQPWETYDEDDMFYPEMTVSNSGILWTWYDFKNLYNDISSYGYHQCSFTTSATSNLQWIDASDEYYINTSNVKLTDDNKLMFDYTASIELNSTEDGRNRNHSFLALFYFVDNGTRDPDNFLSTERGVDGIQIIRYVSPGRANGKAIIESGKNVTVELPSNFDPEKHMIACAVWSIENEPVEYPESNWSSLASPAVLSTPLSVFDLTEYLPEPEPPVVEPPVPEVVRGDADGDGVLNLADVTATMKYLAEWENITIDETAADTNGSGDVNLTDVSLMLQLIAGWNV